MATAVEPSSAPPTPSQPMSLPVASLLGAVYVAAALAVVFYAVPMLWKEHVTPLVNPTGTNNLVEYTLWGPVTVAVLAALVWFGRALAGTNAPRGMHAGIFFMISVAITIFFIVRAIGLNFDGPGGMIACAAVGGLMLFLAVRFFTGRSGERWMVSTEDQGWFSQHQYKRSLGVRVRRLTILGILLIGATGAYSMWTQGVVPDRWALNMPFEMEPVTVLNGAKVAVPALIILAALWFAWRAVNVPDFAEFLIATEAEMNKVSWSSRKRLAQDTVVVLVTTLIMTLFLLVVDVFWGWLLSRQTVGVLPGRATTPEKTAKEAKW